MTWSFAGRERLKGLGAVDVPILLDRSVIVVDIDSPQKKNTWHRAGAIAQIINLDILQNVEIANSETKVSFSPSLIKSELLNGNRYRLRFKPVPWLSEFTISIWQLYE